MGSRQVQAPGAGPFAWVWQDSRIKVAAVLEILNKPALGLARWLQVAAPWQ